jgi:hypothetical protein
MLSTSDREKALPQSSRTSCRVYLTHRPVFCVRLSGPVLTICLSWPQVLNEVVLCAVTKCVAVVLVESRLRLRTDRVGAVEECADVGNPLSEGAVGRCGERIHSRRTTHPRAYRPIATRKIIYAIAALRADACRFTRCQGVLARGRAAQLSAATAHARADAHTWSRALRLPLRCPRPGNCHCGQKHAGDVPTYESHQC